MTERTPDPSRPVAADLDDPAILAAKLSPAIVAALDADEDGIVGAVPSPLARFLLRRAWPWALALVPHAVLAAIRAVVAVFGTMTLDDFLAFLAKRSPDRFRGTDYGHPTTLHDFEAIHLRSRRHAHADGECGRIDCPYCDYAKFLDSPTTKD